MSTIDEVRKLLQDFIAPELSALKESVAAIKESIIAHGQIADARWQAEQAQYATLLTSLELVRQQMKNNHDAVMDKLNAVAKEATAQ